MTNQDALKTFLLDYCEAFRPGNISAVVEFYHSPATMIFGNRISVLSNGDEIASTLQAVLDDLVDRDFYRSRVDSCHVHEFSEYTALLSATFSRLKEDDSVLEQLGATYTVVNKDNGYKIATLVAHNTTSIIS